MVTISRRGYLAKYFYNPFFRRQLVNNDLLEEEHLLKRDKSPPAQLDNPQLAENADNQKSVTEKLEDLVEKTQEPLLKIKTAIPLNPFPDKVIIDVSKITIIYKYFFWSEQIHSVFIKDISDVLVETGWLWSTLKIIDVGFTENSIDINYLGTQDAIKARKIIQGLIVAHKNGLDMSRAELPNLAEKLEQIGKAEKAV